MIHDIKVTDRENHWRVWTINADGLELRTLVDAMIERYERLGVFVGGPYRVVWKEA